MMVDSGSMNNPLANVVAPEQPAGPQQSNPLARIAPQLGGAPAPQPAPTKAQTTAAVQRFSAIQRAMREVMQNKGFGKTNIRPVVLDEASKLLGTKLLSLPEIMNAIGDLPDDPLKQKEAIQGIYNSAQKAEAAILDHHGAAIVAGKLPPDGGADYDSADHEQHMTGLLSQYKRA